MPLPTNCPSCGEPVEVEDRYAGWTVRCPLCRHEFVAPDAPAEDEPGRRHGRRADRLARAARAVADAAVWLRGLGMLEIIGGLLVLLVFTSLAIQAANNPQAAVQNLNVQNEEELWAGITVYLTIGLTWVVAGVLVLIGAGRMARLESHGWAMTAGVIACVPFVNCCCLGLPVGIIALSVLGRPDVHDAFTAARRRREEPDDDPDPIEWPGEPGA